LKKHFGSNNFVKISDSDEPGEGEHKMMKYISERSERHTSERSERHTSERSERHEQTSSTQKKICIYGLDADLIMLSLMNKHADNIILIRDNTFNTKLSEVERIYTYVNIKKLKSLLKNDNINQDDYIFLCFLLGNDFLEHLPSISIKENGLTVLMKYYNYVKKKDASATLVLDTKINLEMLTGIFYQLSNSEEYFFKNVMSVYKVHKVHKGNISASAPKYKDTLDLQEFYKDIYFYSNDIIKFNEDGYKQRYYKYYGINDVDDLCKEYLTGLYWTLGYYRNHSHQNWSWFYPYDATPFASDMYSFLLKHKKNLNICIEKSAPNDTLTQLFMVLPKQSLLSIIKEQDLSLYNKIWRIFNTQSNMLDDFYPSKIYLDMIHKEYLWQSKVFLKNFDKKILDVFF
jgi:5'-3' exoribonuclease 2